MFDDDEMLVVNTPFLHGDRDYHEIGDVFGTDYIEKLDIKGEAAAQARQNMIYHADERGADAIINVKYTYYAYKNYLGVSAWGTAVAFDDDDKIDYYAEGNN